MKWLKPCVRLIGAATFGVIATTPAVPQTPSVLAALSQLERGRWHVRDLDSGETQSLCLRERRVLMQIRHGAGRCEWTVIRNEAREATVTYSCADGSGRTALRVETPRLAQIDSQGVLQGIPYALRAEARLVGSCR